MTRCAGRVLHARIADVPLLRHRPVEHRCAGRHLVDRERQMAAETPSSVSRRPSPVMLRQSGYRSFDAGVHLLPEADRGRAVDGQARVTSRSSRKVRIAPIALDDDAIVRGPRDAEGGIVPTDASCSAPASRTRTSGRTPRCRRPGSGSRGRRSRGRRASSGSRAVSSHRDVLPCRSASRSEVDDHVVDRSHGAADQLGFQIRHGLVVHAAQRPFALVEGHAALDEPRGETVFLELAGAPRASEEPALVITSLWFDDEGAREPG